ncbi:MAG: carbonic anhydrase [Candidatus Micrarchaeota archaeon]
MAGKTAGGKEEVGALIYGNACFLKSADRKKLAELAQGQHPSTIVLTCSDSRVAPELILNCGLGEIFVVRVAGNVAVDPDVLASIEYAAEHLGASLLLVLGHTNCGAVKATCAGQGKGYVRQLIEHIRPAAERAGWDAEKAVVENVKFQMENIKGKSPVVRHLLFEKKLAMRGAVYDLKTGKIELLEE